MTETDTAFFKNEKGLEWQQTGSGMTSGDQNYMDGDQESQSRKSADRYRDWIRLLPALPPRSYRFPYRSATGLRSQNRNVSTGSGGNHISFSRVRKGFRMTNPLKVESCPQLTHHPGDGVHRLRVADFGSFSHNPKFICGDIGREFHGTFASCGYRCCLANRSRATHDSGNRQIQTLRICQDFTRHIDELAFAHLFSACLGSCGGIQRPCVRRI